MIKLEEIMKIPPEKLGEGTDISFTIVEDGNELFLDFAQKMAKEIEKNNKAKIKTNFILPVGPTGQYEVFIDIVKGENLDLSYLSLFFMDEYLTEDDVYIDIENPLSFRGFVNRTLIDPLGDRFGLSPDRVHFPNLRNPQKYRELIEERGGIDISFAGVGINGHLAFNEPAEAWSEISGEEYVNLPTRIVTLSQETRTINSVTAAGGEMEFIPKRAITIGMSEIMGAKKIIIYMNRPWQKAAVRRMLHGEVTPRFPASLVRRHRDVSIIVTREVSELPLPTLA